MAQVQGFFCLPPLLLMQCFCASFFEGSGQSPVVFYSVTTGINEDAAKDMANVRLQLCMFAITITMETKDHWQCRGNSQEGWGWWCLGPTSAVVFLGNVSLYEWRERLNLLQSYVCQRTGQPHGTLLMQSPTATDLHFNDNWLLSKPWTRGLHFWSDLSLPKQLGDRTYL